MFFKKRFHFACEQSPTFYNLAQHLLARGWRRSQSARFVPISDATFDFDAHIANTLEYKHHLAELVGCDGSGIMPYTLCFDDHTALNAIAAAKALHQTGCFWIVKPAMLNNGQHIHLFNDLLDLEKHVLGTKRMGGPHVLQRYIQNPHLLRDRRKYSVRLFVVFTNDDGAFLFPEGYFNVAATPYELQNLSDLRSHLTNEHLLEHEINVIQIPARRFEWYPSLHASAMTLLRELFKRLRQRFLAYPRSNTPRQLAIFGMDFLPDASGKLWLLEANHGPCFPKDTSHPLQNELYEPFWNAFIDDFILPIARKTALHQLNYQTFERIF